MIIDHWTGNVLVFFAGLISKEALAAMATSTNIYVILIGIVFGLNTASAQSVGYQVGEQCI